MTISRRLRLALIFADRGIRDFHRELELTCKKKGVSGSSYTMVHNYLQGRREPSLGLLRESAKILGVREAWLVLGEGEPTVSEEALEYERTTDAVYEQIYDWVPELLDGPRGHPEAFHDALGKWVLSAPGSNSIKTSKLGPMARGLYDLVYAPLECWGFRSKLPPELETEYFLAMLTALRIAMAPRSGGDLQRSFPKVFQNGLPVRSPRGKAKQEHKRSERTKPPKHREE